MLDQRDGDSCQKHRNVVEALFDRAAGREPVIEDGYELKAEQGLDTRQHHARLFNGLGRHLVEGRPIRGGRVSVLLHAKLESAEATAATRPRFLLRRNTVIADAR